MCSTSVVIQVESPEKNFRVVTGYLARTQSKEKKEKKIKKFYLVFVCTWF